MARGAERIVIVGAGPAGLSTARAYRACGGEGAVTLVGEEPRPPYRRPPLSKEFLRGELDAEELQIEPPSWFEENEVTLLLGRSATAIDPARGVVTLEGPDRLEADTIVLATGSQPVRPPVPGTAHPNVHTLRTLPDSERIAAAGAPARHVLVIGTGFIGCEVAASLAMREARVTLIGEQSLPQLGRLGRDVAEHIAAWLEELGVELIGGARVSLIRDGATVELEDGRSIRGEAVVLGTGVRPRVELAQAAGLELRDGAVAVDGALRSPSSPGNVMAVGDSACAFNASAGRPLRIEHWGDALGHGAVAGEALATGTGCWRDVPGFWSTIGERTLKYASWGEGFEQARVVADADGAFTVWYERAGTLVGVLTHERDDDYERGRELIANGGRPE